jgi:hypothetical protein
MSKTSRRGRVRLQPYVDASLSRRLDAFCAAIGASESAVVHAALVQYLDRTGDWTLVMRRLDRLGRAGARTQRDLEFLSEAFGLWVKLWFAHTPTIPEDAKPSARISAQGRYEQFIAHLAEQFSQGGRFVDDLPRESLADDAELEATARAAEDTLAAPAVRPTDRPV